MTIPETISIAAILDGCQRNAVATWEDKNERHTGLASGTMRSVCNERGAAFPTDQDVREAHVWITTRSGLEWMPTMRSILDLYDQGLFALDM
jgi:hypothetical protein